jgi:hypothetical protein
MDELDRLIKHINAIYEGYEPLREQLWPNTHSTPTSRQMPMREDGVDAAPSSACYAQASRQQNRDMDDYALEAAKKSTQDVWRRLDAHNSPDTSHPNTNPTPSEPLKPSNDGALVDTTNRNDSWWDKIKSGKGFLDRSGDNNKGRFKPR